MIDSHTLYEQIFVEEGRRRAWVLGRGWVGPLSRGVLLFLALWAVDVPGCNLAALPWALVITYLTSVGIVSGKSATSVKQLDRWTPSLTAQ